MTELKALLRLLTLRQFEKAHGRPSYSDMDRVMDGRQASQARKPSKVRGDRGNFLGDVEMGLSHLSRPAAVLNAARALLKDAQNIGISPTSVGGGEKASGNCEANAGFCGPGSVTLAGLSLVLMAPCGGRSGLPNGCAFAAMLAVRNVPAGGEVGTFDRNMGCMKRLLKSFRA